MAQTFERSPELRNQPAYYASHLSEVDKTNAVVSTEDIYNDRGVLLVRKGARISDEQRAKLLRHRLAKPIHRQVDIERTLDPIRLQERFESLLNRYSDLADLLDGQGLRRDLMRTIEGTELPSLFTQKLTVMAQQAPRLFEKALFVSTLCLLLARSMSLPPSEVRAAYLAGLVHDIGLLHIDPEVLAKTHTLSAEDWRAIQSHVVLGQLLVEEAGRTIPPLTARAVLEHHERWDGSGYPTAKSEQELCTIGQLVGAADSLEAIRTSKLEQRRLHLGYALPYVQLNTSTFSEPVYEHLYALLKSAPLEMDQTTLGDSERLARRLGQQGVVLQRACETLEALQQAVIDAPPSRRFLSLQRVPERVVRTMTQAGLLGDALTSWLDAEASRPYDARGDELMSIELMHSELHWQLNSIRRALDEYVNHHLPSDAAEREALANLLAALNRHVEALGEQPPEVAIHA